MKHYEIMYIIPVKIGEDQALAVQEKVHAMLVGEGANITSEENLGKRKLAYPIDHIRHGTYVVAEFDLDPAKLAKVNDWFRLSSEVLRAQILSKQVKNPEQLAREKAFQEKLSKLQAKSEVVEEKESESTKKSNNPSPKVKLDELDKKLEEILGKEVVK